MVKLKKKKLNLMCWYVLLHGCGLRNQPGYSLNQFGIQFSRHPFNSLNPFFFKLHFKTPGTDKQVSWFHV